jgi:hypothetical protein
MGNMGLKKRALPTRAAHKNPHNQFDNNGVDLERSDIN